MEVCRYIEPNPMRACMVDSPSETDVRLGHAVDDTSLVQIQPSDRSLIFLAQASPDFRQ